MNVNLTMDLRLNGEFFIPLIDGEASSSLFISKMSACSPLKQALKSGHRKQLKIILESFKQHFMGLWEVGRQLQFLKILKWTEKFQK